MWQISKFLAIRLQERLLWKGGYIWSNHRRRKIIGGPKRHLCVLCFQKIFDKIKHAVLINVLKKTGLGRRKTNMVVVQRGFGKNMCSILYSSIYIPTILLKNGRINSKCRNYRVITNANNNIWLEINTQNDDDFH